MSKALEILEQKYAYNVCEHDYEYAAKEAADLMDRSGGGEATERTIHVRNVDEPKTVKLFSIIFDYSIDYFANEIEVQS